MLVLERNDHGIGVLCDTLISAIGGAKDQQAWCRTAVACQHHTQRTCPFRAADVSTRPAGLPFQHRNGHAADLAKGHCLAQKCVSVVMWQIAFLSSMCHSVPHP